MNKTITRFAPSPSGFLHLGHAYAALVAHAWGQPMRLRIEDIDHMVCRNHFVTAIHEDLDWLGLDYHPEVTFQQSNIRHYQRALQRLQQLRVVYPCFCSRSDIRRAQVARAPHKTGTRYPGTCRSLTIPQRQALQQQKPFAWRLDATKAQALVGQAEFSDHRFGRKPADLSTLGDMVIARKDGLISYHLAVVCDDAQEGITLVTRGEDLLEITPLHVILQHLLELPTPDYLHHHLIRDSAGNRLAKRTDAQAIRAYRDRGLQPEQLWDLCPKPDSDFPEN